MVGPNGFEPSTSSVSRKRSRPTELRAYAYVSILLANALTGNPSFVVVESRTISIASGASRV